MDQAQINRDEWENPDNWSRRSGCGLYFSKRDTRIWVPTPTRGMGWTLNLAHRAGAASFLALFTLPALLFAGLLVQCYV